MAFIVEDGTGVLGATSYGTVQDFRDYHADRGVTLPSVLDSAVQALLVAATDYIDTRWGSRLLGLRQFAALASRSVFTLTAIPLEGETLTFGAITYTFTATPTLVTDVEIGADTFETLNTLAVQMAASQNDDFAGAAFADPDVASLTLFANSDGVITTETSTVGSFDLAVTAGKSGKRQSLEFPRTSLRDRSGLLVVGVPGKLEAATFEYALRANTVTLAPDPAVDASGNRIVGTKTKVGPIETETRFAEQTTPQITRPYPAADRLLQEYVMQPGTSRV